MKLEVKINDRVFHVDSQSNENIASLKKFLEENFNNDNELNICNSHDVFTIGSSLAKPGSDTIDIIIAFIVLMSEETKKINKCRQMINTCIAGLIATLAIGAAIWVGYYYIWVVD